MFCVMVDEEDEERTYSFIFMPRICSRLWLWAYGGANNVICCGSASCMARHRRNAGLVTMCMSIVGCVVISNTRLPILHSVLYSICN